MDRGTRRDRELRNSRALLRSNSASPTPAIGISSPPKENRCFARPPTPISRSGRPITSLNAPPNVASTTRAFWYAAAMAANEDVETAERVSRTKVATFPITCKFWKDVARFFARNPAPVLEMNALIDYLQVAKDMDATYDVHGRSLPSLRRQMAGWHRKLRETNTLDTDKWQGQPIPDAIYRTDGENGAATWRLHQITNGKELVSEGMRMQHCVVAYKSQCMQGLSSIWSLTCEYPAGKFNRGITVECGARTPSRNAEALPIAGRPRANSRSSDSGPPITGSRLPSRRKRTAHFRTSAAFPREIGHRAR